ncbi:MAG: DNA mismatch repair protein MutS, partial [Bacteroidetes bacterium]|nr:DNA mismatch repair protein MutS [Bacteroidota bacterium]
SYGIQVAEMAGLPAAITKRAKQILKNLESKELTPMEARKMKPAVKATDDEVQFALFEVKDDKLRKEIEELEVEKLTPLEALNKLDELKRKMRE